jgi:hypothetical protein
MGAGRGLGRLRAAVRRVGALAEGVGAVVSASSQAVFMGLEDDDGSDAGSPKRTGTAAPAATTVTEEQLTVDVASPDAFSVVAACHIAAGTEFEVPAASQGDGPAAVPWSKFSLNVGGVALAPSGNWPQYPPGGAVLVVPSDGVYVISGRIQWGARSGSGGAATRTVTVSAFGKDYRFNAVFNQPGGAPPAPLTVPFSLVAGTGDDPAAPDRLHVAVALAQEGPGADEGVYIEPMVGRDLGTTIDIMRII